MTGISSGTVRALTGRAPKGLAVLMALAAAGAAVPQAAQAGVLFADNFDGRTTLDPAGTLGYVQTHTPLTTTGEASIDSVSGCLTLTSGAGSKVAGAYFLSADPGGTELPFPFGGATVHWTTDLRVSRTGTPAHSTGMPSFAGGLILTANSELVSPIAMEGVAVILLPDRLQLRHFTSGMGAATEMASIPLTDLTSTSGLNEWFNIDVTYDAATSAWTLKARDAAGSGTWQETTQIVPLTTPNWPYMGYYAQYNAASYAVSFDNVSLSADAAAGPPAPEPATVGLLAAGGAALLLRRRRGV